ncbi:MAG TPA: tetratricopeptide repeat protein [Caulobacteraceae bacterium]|nr:tetratricopeptide repeat protein [Caulobacteraceae bacterium]
MGASVGALNAVDEPPRAAQIFGGDETGGEAASKAALERLNRAVAELNALQAGPLLERAVAAIKAEDGDTASKLAIEALQHDEKNGFGWHVLAIAREMCGDFKSSIAAYESALALLADHTDVANDLGRLAFRLGMKPLAAKLFAVFHQARPDNIDGANNLACALRDLHEYAAAIELLQGAIPKNPGSAMLWNTLATVLSAKGETASAIPFLEEALRLDPAFAKARYNLANAKLELGDPDAALADCDAAMAQAATPGDLAMMRLARSTILLCAGRVGEGWDDYEARFDPAFSDLTHFMTDRPRWSPDTSPKGKSVLVIGEQGLGDEIMFANLIPDLLEEVGPDGQLAIAVEARLVGFFQRAFPAAHVSAHTTYKLDGHTVRAAPDAPAAETLDLWTPLATPLRRYRRSVAAFPDRAHYMTADPTRVDHWRAWASSLPGKSVGLVWKSLKLDGVRLREFSPFEQWRGVLQTPGLSFVNLQYGECEAELAAARERLGVTIHQAPGIDLKDDLDEVAALVCALDLVLGPANATTNIAGACGAATWLISTPIAWTRLGTSRYPWYPQSRVFTPSRFGQWDKVMAEVVEALGAFAVS